VHGYPLGINELSNFVLPGSPFRHKGKGRCQATPKGRLIYSRGHPKEDDMDNTTLLILIIVILLVVGGGWYGRGRWF
jgi:hypothetical protein